MKVICKFSCSGTEEEFDGLREAEEALEEEYETCYADEQLAANIYEILRDIREVADVNGGYPESVYEIEDMCNADIVGKTLVFSR